MPIVTIKGEITADGTLKLSEPLQLPKGAVSVTLRTLNGPASHVGSDVQAGRKAEEGAADMVNYEDLPDRDE